MTLDLVCHVVDNYGDIAVVWRLAQALMEDTADGSRGKWQIRILVDDLAAFHALTPLVDPSLAVQEIAVPGHRVTVVRSTDKMALRALPLPDVIVEAFGAPTPVERLEAFFVASATELRARVVIHLEYLTAEAYSEDYHLLPSPLGRTGVERHFFVPGFRRHTGGLVFTDRSAALGTADLPPELRRGDETWLVTVFSYEHDFSHLWEDLAAYLQRAETPATARVMVLAGRPREGALASWQRNADPAITVQLVPFVDQDTYTALVNQADFNLVRGEESWVVAALSGKPFLWHAYLQDDNHQLVKIDAFLDVLAPEFATDGPEAQQAFAAMAAEFRAFNTRPATAPLRNSADDAPLEHYSVFFEHHEVLSRVLSRWALQMRNSAKLSRRLLDFLNSFRV
ncbi:MAG: elongation factor P maturation arginine rhamnosyltransferase EarP [Spirochaetales bacterium]